MFSVNGAVKRKETQLSLEGVVVRLQKRISLLPSWFTVDETLTDHEGKYNLHYSASQEDLSKGIEFRVHAKKEFANIVLSSKSNPFRNPNSNISIVLELSGSPFPSSRLEEWLLSNPRISQKMMLFSSELQYFVPYSQWDSYSKDILKEYFDKIGHFEATNLPDAPQLMIVPGDTQYATDARISNTVATQYILAHIAFALAAEINSWFPWSILNYSDEELSLLLDGNSVLQYVMSNLYRVPIEYWTSPGDPMRTYLFLLANNCVRSNSMSSILMVLKWGRENLGHFAGYFHSYNIENHWGYRGAPPIERILNGTTRSTDNQFAHFTAGCWGTAGFLRVLLRVLNIPVLTLVRGNHALPYFISENLYLSHGDDIYNGAFVSMPYVNTGAILVDQNEFNEWFGSHVPSEKIKKNVGRKSRELAKKHVSPTLVCYYCRDLGMGRNHAESLVYEFFKDDYTVEELEKDNLWNELEYSRRNYGGCQNVPRIC